MAYDHAAPRGIHLRDVTNEKSFMKSEHEGPSGENAEAAHKVPKLEDLISAPPDSATPRSFWARLGEKAATRVVPTYLVKLGMRRGAVQAELRSIPERLQKLTNQAALMLELVDDFRAGRYRAVALRNLAVGAGALLYAVSPTDVIPDIFPAVGALDDALVIGIALRIMRRDLLKYCAHKGYDPKNYF